MTRQTSPSSRSHKDTVKKQFATSVRNELHRRGMTQRDLCRLTGMKPFEINKHLTERIAPRPEKVTLVAEALNLHPDDLVPGYVQAEGKPFGANFKAMGNGKVWIEISGAYDHDDAMRIIGSLGQAHLHDRLQEEDSEEMSDGEK